MIYYLIYHCNELLNLSRRLDNLNGNLLYYLFFIFQFLFFNFYFHSRMLVKVL